MAAPKWSEGMEKIGPGMYVRGDELHLDTDELCASCGVPPSAHNIRVIAQAAKEVVRGANAKALVEHRETH